MEDALFNWLQIHIVAKARPEDRAAQETADFFYEIVSEDHLLKELTYEVDDTSYTVKYTLDGTSHGKRFDRIAVEQLLRQIESEPRYN